MDYDESKISEEAKRTDEIMHLMRTPRKCTFHLNGVSCCQLAKGCVPSLLEKFDTAMVMEQLAMEVNWINEQEMHEAGCCGVDFRCHVRNESTEVVLPWKPRTPWCQPWWKLRKVLRDVNVDVKFYRGRLLKYKFDPKGDALYINVRMPPVWPESILIFRALHFWMDLKEDEAWDVFDKYYPDSEPPNAYVFRPMGCKNADFIEGRVQ